MHVHRGKRSTKNHPFWLPAANYYLLASIAVLILFFLIWMILRDESAEAPFVSAGVVAGFLAVGAIALREIVLRNARQKYLVSQRLLDLNIQAAHPALHTSKQNNSSKFTLERNNAILAEIAKKSAAAKILGRFPEGHREVFELCDEYIAAAARELPNIGVGSPRIAALRRGRRVAIEFHHYHLLQWAEIVSRSLTQEAQKHAKLSEKLDSTHKALEAVELALRSYPHEPDLLATETLLREYIVSVKLSNLVERAEKAEFDGNTKRAIKLYKDALFLIKRDAKNGDETLSAAKKFANEIDRLSDSIASN